MKSAPATANWLSTEEFATALRLKPQTLRKGLCTDGHYLGVRPTKLPNRRLLWPAAAVEKLTGGAAA